MKFSKMLKKAMRELNLTQAQVVGMTGCSKGAISMYLNDKTEPHDSKKSSIAVSLGLAPNYFEQNQDVDTRTVVLPKTAVASGEIKKLMVEDAAKILGMNHNTVRKGLQQGVFPWGYAIRTSENRWVYFINAARFAEIEGITI